MVLLRTTFLLIRTTFLFKNNFSVLLLRTTVLLLRTTVPFWGTTVLLFLTTVLLLGTLVLLFWITVLSVSVVKEKEYHSSLCLTPLADYTSGKSLLFRRMTVLVSISVYINTSPGVLSKYAYHYGCT